MVTANQITPGLILEIDGEVFRVETAIKVSATKGNPFMKTKLRDLKTEKLIEKNFKLAQKISEVKPLEHILEYLYTEQKNFVFLDTETLEKVYVSNEILGKKSEYLKEGIQVKSVFFGSAIFSVELLQFLELMIIKTEDKADTTGATMKIATLETGAKIDIPLFVESGDIIKVDTHAGEYIQRV